MADGYQDDLAYIHDTGFGFHARGAGPGLLALLRDSGVAHGLVVDLGCGSGLWARQLLDAGYSVHGIDQSPAMLQMARRRCPEAAFQRASFLEARLPSCEAVTAMGEIFNYLFDEATGRGALARFVRRVYEALRPGGVFAFDIAEPGRAGGRGRLQKHFQGDDWAVLLVTEETDGILTRDMTTFRRVGRMYRRGHEVHRLRLYRGQDLAADLRRVGFRVRLTRTYGDYSLPRGTVALIARKT
jgi:SAM-dependent methyltransferase